MSADVVRRDRGGDGRLQGGIVSESAESAHTCHLELEALYAGRRDPDCAGCRSVPKTENGAIHWGHEDARPTSLHGNGAATLGRTTLDPAEVTCRLCLTLLANSESLSWIDQQGDVWRVGEDGLMWTPETAPFPREHVEKKWGPLRLVDPIYSPGEGGLGGEG